MARISRSSSSTVAHVPRLCIHRARITPAVHHDIPRNGAHKLIFLLSFVREHRSSSRLSPSLSPLRARDTHEQKRTPLDDKTPQAQQTQQSQRLTTGFFFLCAAFLSLAGLSRGPIMKPPPSGTAKYTIETLAWWCVGQERGGGAHA